MSRRSIRTFTGALIDPLKPDPLLIDYIDIIHSLSGECRYTNHTSSEWPVGSHSLVVMRMVPDEFQFDALMHDASEAYLRDVPGPVKHRPEFASYRRIEARLQAAIAKRFGFAYPEPTEVKLWDDVVLKYEQFLFMRGHDIPEPEKLGIRLWQGERILSLIKDYRTRGRDEMKSIFLEHFYALRARRCFAAS